jgi:ribosome recycling factor
MLDNLKKETENKMQKTIESFNHDLAKIRTGRAHPSLLESILVDYYGQSTSLNQVASISVQDARTLTVTPFDKKTAEAIDKAIRTSNLGLNPISAGAVIRVPLPPLNEERRLQFDANAAVKKLLKDKEISEDQEKKFADQVQKTTDKFVEQIDKHSLTKEQELLTL